MSNISSSMSSAMSSGPGIGDSLGSHPGTSASTSMGGGNGPHSSSNISAVANNYGPGIGDPLGNHPGVYATTTIGSGPGIGDSLGFAPGVVASTNPLNAWAVQPDILSHLLTPNIPGVTPDNIAATHNLADRQVAQHVASFHAAQAAQSNYPHTTQAAETAFNTYGAAMGAFSYAAVGTRFGGTLGGLAGAAIGGIVGGLSQGYGQDVMDQSHQK